MKTFVTALSVAAVAQASIKAGTIHHGSAPILEASNADAISGSYIIKFKDHVDASKADRHHGWIQSIHDASNDDQLELRKRGVSDIFTGMKHTYNIGDFRGYAGHFDDDVIEQIRNHPDVSPRSSVPFHVRI